MGGLLLAGLFAYNRSSLPHNHCHFNTQAQQVGKGTRSSGLRRHPVIHVYGAHPQTLRRLVIGSVSTRDCFEGMNRVKWTFSAWIEQVVNIANDQRTLKEIENKILYMLANASGGCKPSVFELA